MFIDEPYTWRTISTEKPGRCKIEHGSEKGQMLSTGFSDPQPGSTIWSWTWQSYMDEYYHWTFRHANMDEKDPGPLEIEDLKKKLEEERKRADEAEKRATAAERKATACEQRIKDLESRTADAEKKAADTEKKAADVEKKATDAARRITELEKQLKDEKDDRQTFDFKQQELESSRSQLKDHASKAAEAQKSAETQLKGKQQEVDDLMNQLDEAKAAQSTKITDGAVDEADNAAATKKSQQLQNQEVRLQQKEQDLAKREAQIKQAETDRSSAPRDPNAVNGAATKAMDHTHAPGCMPHLDPDCAFGGDHLFCFSAHQNHEFTFLPRLR